MKIAVLIGSPKGAKSTSFRLFKELQGLVNGEHECQELILDNPEVSAAGLQAIAESDILILSFPLYFDGIPGHFLACLPIIAKMIENQKHKPTVYALVHAGFFEGKQCVNAIACCKNWVAGMAAIWGGGVGIGAGAALASLKQVALGQGKRKSLGVAFTALAKAISDKRQVPDAYLSPDFPRFVYKLLVHRNWYASLKHHNLKRKDLYRRLP